uniref:Fibrinogen C-terminal domain-containing protein n=1 Tax=Gopherus agassizii TaxID=38772 RepID=A0A452IKW9_9SAUR
MLSQLPREGSLAPNTLSEPSLTPALVLAGESAQQRNAARSLPAASTETDARKAASACSSDATQPDPTDASEGSRGYTTHLYHSTPGCLPCSTGCLRPLQVFCDMETERGGWTVIQRRTNGSVNFQRKWKEYKQGFGDPAGEYWLGNEAVHLLTSQASYSLRVELLDWEGNQAYAHYETFQLGSERHLYRISLKGYSGTAGQQSGIVLQGINFSTRDSDNDNCFCKCAQMLSGGWWFDACGLSNLNGIYYPAKHNVRKLNGIRWHYFQGPSYSLKGTRMMIRPSDF